MYSAKIENFALFYAFMKNCVESETFGSCFQTKQYMLVVRNCYYVIIRSVLFVGHHWTHTHCYTHTLTTHSACTLHHVFSSIKAVHL